MGFTKNLNIIVRLALFCFFLGISFTSFAICTAPSAQTFSLSVNGSAISWVNGNGAGRVVYINTSNSFVAPVNGTNPVASTTYTSGQKCVYNGTSNTVFVTGLVKGTTYWIKAYEYCLPDRVYSSATGTNNPISFVRCPVSPELKITPGGTTTFCPGSPVSVNLAASSGYTSYVWSTGATTTSINATSVNTYSVTVTASNACTSQARIALKTSPTCNFNLQVKLFLQGFYLGSGQMAAVLDPINKPTVCDSVTISLARGTAPNDILYSKKAVVGTNGICNTSFTTTTAYTNYYIVVSSRNGLQTWSKAPVYVTGSSLTYDFTSNTYPNQNNGNFIFNAGHSCKTILNQYPASTSGFYWLDPDDEGPNYPIQCYCDMTTQGGGWTLVAQHSTFGGASFAATTYAVATGTGVLTSGVGTPKNGELWVGLSHWNLLGSEMMLQMNSLSLISPNLTNYIARWSTFNVNPFDKFRLNIGGFSSISGGIGDDWSYVNNAQFSTYDVDNDAIAGSCAVTYKGMGWHLACFSFKLFGDNGGNATSYADGGPISSSITGYYVGLSPTPWWAGIWLR